MLHFQDASIVLQDSRTLRPNMVFPFTKNPMPTVKMPASSLYFVRAAKRMAWICLAATACLNAAAQGNGSGDLPAVTISAKANPDPVEKSYRKMIRGMDLFEQERGRLSPNGSLRFKLLPRRPDTDLSRIEMEVIGTTVDFPVPIAPDQTFTLARHQKAYDENAQVSPNRRAQSMTWRTEIKTPGLPPGTRRLGDLRLECRVGMESGLISNRSNIVGRMVKALLGTPAYCDRQVPLYLFFAERPLFSVALVAGPRREILSIDMLYAAASDDPKLQDELPYCDCEVLVDRTYVLPLGDRSWPDDTRVEFEYMEDE
ncbi:MAG: hypothetical protein JWP79_891 [Polaromonas sp.]|nr:hypothetical protein [Polaromonas sp.]